MDPAVAQQLSANLVVDAQADMRAHGRYLQVMDRSFLHEYLESQDSMAGRAANLNTASHVPSPQPWVVPNFVTPTGSMPK